MQSIGGFGALKVLDSKIVTLFFLVLGVAGWASIGLLPNGLKWPVRALSSLVGSLGLAGVLLCLRPGLSLLTEGLRKPNQQWDGILIVILALMHGLMIYNSATHDPVGNPDWHRHYDALNAWSEGRMLEEGESRAIYYPPLAYWPPALAQALGIPKYGAIRLGMFFNVAYSLVAMLYMLRILRLIAPDSLGARRVALLGLATLPLYLKSFAMQRPEPLLTALAMMALFYGCQIFVAHRFQKSIFLMFGLSMGLALLTRQWAFFLVPGFLIGLYYLIRYAWPARRQWFLGLSGATAVAVLVAGWFYVALEIKYGSATVGPSAVNVDALAKKDAEFFIGMAPEILFTRPVAWNLDFRFWPILISEIYGDYYGYWHHPRVGQTMFGHDYSSEEYAFADFLGFANRIGVVLLALSLCALIFCVARKYFWDTAQGRMTAICLGCALGSFGGLYWFNLTMLHGYAVQPVYVLQMFPMLGVLVGLGWHRAWLRFPKLTSAATILYFGLALCLLPLWTSNMPRSIGLERLGTLNHPALWVLPLLASAWLVVRSLPRHPSDSPQHLDEVADEADFSEVLNRR